MTPTGETYANWSTPNVRVYRQPKSALLIAIVCLVFFPLMTAAGVALPPMNPDGSFARPVLAAIVFGCFWGGWSVSSVYLPIAYLRVRLYTSDVVVRQVGVVRSRTVALAAITRAVWRGWPARGSLVLYTTDSRLVVRFGNYTDPGELAALFRAALPPQVQDRYERFESTSVPASQAFRLRRDREKRRSDALLPIVGLGLVALAFWDP